MQSTSFPQHCSICKKKSDLCCVRLSQNLHFLAYMCNVTLHFAPKSEYYLPTKKHTLNTNLKHKEGVFKIILLNLCSTLKVVCSVNFFTMRPRINPWHAKSITGDSYICCGFFRNHHSLSYYGSLLS